MALVTPGIGLVFWQTVLMAVIPMFLIAWIMILATNRLDATQKLVWLLGTMFLPLIGPLLFFVKYKSFKKPAVPQS